MNERQNHKWNGRALVSLALVGALLLVIASGAVLYAAPRGRTARWGGWTLWGLRRDEWAGLHMCVCLLLVVLAATHLVLNWKIFRCYVVRTGARGVRCWRELAVAGVLLAAVVAGAVAMWPPFGTVVRWNQQIKAYWQRTGPEAPLARAEELTLEQFARLVGVSGDGAAEALRGAGFEVADRQVTMADLARAHGVSPARLFEAIRAKYPEAKSPFGEGAQSHRGQGRSGGRGQGRGMGRGLGRG